MKIHEITDWLSSLVLPVRDDQIRIAAIDTLSRLTGRPKIHEDRRAAVRAAGRAFYQRKRAAQQKEAK